MLFSRYYPAQFISIREKGYLLGSFLYSLSFNSKKTLLELVESIVETKRIKQESDLLKRELEELIFRQKSYYEEIEAANLRLQELLNFKKQSSFHLIPAEVLAYSPEDFFKVLYINKGRQDGVVHEMPVVNHQGLVGKVVEVHSNGAKVMLIVDKRSKVGIRVQRTRDVGIIQGTGNPEVCDLHYILTKAEIEVGDAVVTSGLGEIFPKGIIVGYISSIEKKPHYIFQQIKVEPSVDFGKLEELFLIAQKK